MMTATILALIVAGILLLAVFIGTRLIAKALIESVITAGESHDVPNCEPQVDFPEFHPYQ